MSHGLDESSVMEKEDFLDFWDFSKVGVAKITFSDFPEICISPLGGRKFEKYYLIHKIIVLPHYSIF